MCASGASFLKNHHQRHLTDVVGMAARKLCGTGVPRGSAVLQLANFVARVPVSSPGRRVSSRTGEALNRCIERYAATCHQKWFACSASVHTVQQAGKSDMLIIIVR